MSIQIRLVCVCYWTYCTRIGFWLVVVFQVSLQVLFMLERFSALFTRIYQGCVVSIFVAPQGRDLRKRFTSKASFSFFLNVALPTHKKYLKFGYTKYCMNIIKGWKIFLHGNNWSQNLPTHPTHLPLLLHPTLDHPLLHLHPFMGSGHMILQIIMMFVRLPTDVTNFLALVRRGMVCPQMTALFVRFTTDFTRVWTLTCMNSGMYFQLEALYKTLTTNVTPKYLYFYSISPTY